MEAVFVSVKEAAAAIGMCSSTLYAWVGKKGGPPYVRHGRKIRIRRDQFLKWAGEDRPSIWSRKNVQHKRQRRVNGLHAPVSD